MRHDLSARNRRRSAFAAAVAVLVVAGCGDDGDTAASSAPEPFTECELVSTSTAKPTATLSIQLSDYAVVSSAPSVAAGAVQFDTKNVGQRPHELVIVKGGSAASLPKDKDGSMAEEKLADNALIGEIEEFPTGEDCTGVFDLEPGKYVLLCNLVEKVNGKTVAHFAQGMFGTLTVTS